jgi:hypothetical protein
MICLLHLGVKENECIVTTRMLNNYILSSVSDEIFFRSSSPDAPNPYETILGSNFE